MSGSYLHLLALLTRSCGALVFEDHLFSWRQKFMDFVGPEKKLNISAARYLDFQAVRVCVNNVVLCSFSGRCSEIQLFHIVWSINF